MSLGILDEVRRIREDHAASMGYDLDRIYADLKSRQEQREAEGWDIVSPPASPLPEIDLTLQHTRFTHAT
jgi:hypothetical protein